MNLVTSLPKEWHRYGDPLGGATVKKNNTVSVNTNTITYIRKSREKRLITKEHIATHTYLNFKALCSSTVAITL